MNYYLEIKTEEIPARFVELILNNLKDKLAKALTLEKICFSEIQAYATYRRLVYLITDLPTTSSVIQKEIKGPAIKIALDENQDFLPAGLGFLKRIYKEVGLTSEVEIEPKLNIVQEFPQAVIKLFTKLDNNEAYLYADLIILGKPVKDILAVLIPTTIRNLELPIAMRWGNNLGPFIRPIHEIISMLDEELVEFDLFGIKAQSSSVFKLEVKGDDVPFEPPIIIDQNERKEVIKKIVAQYVEDYDETLLDEVNYLVENPTGLIGSFSKDFLQIPEEILVECMRKHQKYFPIYQDHKLTNKFIIIAENVTELNEKNIIDGNQAVLVARLEDVKFFWQEDIKTNFSVLNEKLQHMVFQKKSRYYL